MSIVLTHTYITLSLRLDVPATRHSYLRITVSEWHVPALTLALIAPPHRPRSWPIALSGRDIISVARTGSGKTLGFLLPAFHALLNRPGGCKPRMGSGPYIVVLAPTRELACQINEEATKFGKAAGIRSTTVYGESHHIPVVFVFATTAFSTLLSWLWAGATFTLLHLDYQKCRSY